MRHEVKRFNSLNGLSLALLVFAILNFEVYAQISRPEPGVEVTTIKKVFRYVSTLGDHPSILIVYERQNNESQTILDAFRAEKYFVATTTLNDLQSVISNFDVIYVMPGTDIRTYKEIFLKSKALVISGDHSLVATGLAAISVAEEKDRPVIFLNLRFLNQSGHKVSAELINLSKVYK